VDSANAELALQNQKFTNRNADLAVLLFVVTNIAITRERQTPGDGATQSYGPGGIQAAELPNVTKKPALSAVESQPAFSSPQVLWASGAS
jgi:hypothetical protein